jgi:DNA-binding MarR family transcriptional regulator
MSKPQEKKPNACMCGAIRRGNRAVTQFYDLALAPAGMRASQFMTLNAISKATEIAQSDFGRKYAISVESLSRRFKNLREKGLIASRIGTHSERIYRLTPHGEQILRDAMPYWNAGETWLRQTLEERVWRLFLELCYRTVCAAHEAEQLRTRNTNPAHASEISSHE